MSTTAAPVEVKAPSYDGAFIAHRLGSILALLPLGVWTAIHVWNQLAIFRGGQAWQAQVTEYQHPYASLLLSIVVLVPLALHTIWGLGRLRSTRPNNMRYGFFDNLRYVLQRAAAVGVLLFLGAHLWLAFLHPRFVEGHPEAWDDIAREMRYNIPTLPVYLLGTLGVAYHLGNGIASIGMGWGLTASKKGMVRWQAFGIALFVLLWAMSWGALYKLYDLGGSY